MEKEAIVQFVSFETAGNNDEFISQWDQYSKELKNKNKVKLLQEIGSTKRTKYLSQHWCYDDDFEFVFKKERRSAHFPEVEMRVRQLGGYTIMQAQCNRDTQENETKIFVFISSRATDIEECKQLSHYLSLNIYKAYFQSSNYDYILEFFVANDFIESFMTQLKSQNRHIESGMYKECELQELKAGS